MTSEVDQNETLREANSSTANQFHQTSPEHRVIKLALQTIIFLVGVLGNALVCFVTSRKRGQTSTGNLFILHLAIADLGILFVNFPFVLLRIEFQFAWPFGRFICRTVYPFADIFFGVEIGCITAIAFHRYKMLVHCTKPQITLDNAKKIVFLIWLISFTFIVAPLIFVMDLKSASPQHHKDCVPLWPNRLSEQLFSINGSLMFYVIPLSVILITYIKIRAVLDTNNERSSSYRLCRGHSTRSSTARASQNRRAVQILTPVVVIFALTMLPITIFRFVVIFINKTVLKSFRYKRLVFDVCAVLLIANSSVNPIIYSVVNSEFRRDFSNYLHCNGDRCCLDTRERGLTTFRKSSLVPANNGGRRSSAPLLRQDGVSPWLAYMKTQRRSLDSAIRDMVPRLQSGDQHDISKNLQPTKRALYIKVNPTYESGGF